MWGGAAVYANYTSGSGTTTLTFRYTVQASDVDADGIDIFSPIELNAGSLKDAAGNDASLTFTDGNILNLNVDGDSPFVSSLNLPADNNYLNGDELALEVVFSENVIVAGGTPEIDIDVGGSTQTLRYLSGSGTNTLRFRWFVTSGLYDDNGIGIAASINLNGATIQDATFNNARLDLMAPLTPGVLVDSRLPQITNIVAPANNDYTDGMNLDFAFEFSEVVTVIGTPRVQFQLTSGNVYADYLSGSGSNVIVFRYTVQPGDSDSDGILFASNLIDLNSGSITGLASLNNADLDFTAQVPADMTGIKVNENNNATQLVITQQPTDALAGNNINPAITVELRDAGNNLVNTATNSVTLAFSADPSSGAASINGTVTVAAVAGIATFSDINIDRAFNNYSFEFSATGLTSASSNTFNITPNVKTQLVYNIQPSNAEVAANINPAIEVEIHDAFGNKTTDTDSITLAINNDPAGGSILGGTLSVAAINGSANFNDININQAGVGFTLDASAAGLTSATSNTFDINAVPTQLVITQQPTDAGNEIAINPAVTIEIRDASNNLVTSATNNVTVAIGTDPSLGAATLAGTLTVAAVGGIATFSDLNIDVINNGYTLDFSSGALTAASSNTFNIVQAPATQLVFNTQPSNALAGVNIAPDITVEFRDANNNLVPSEASNVTLAFGTDASFGAGTLAGTLTVAAVGGIATFNDINIDRTGVGFTLQANSGVLPSATSTAFNIDPNTKAQLAFFTQPSDADISVNINPAIEVEIQDAYGNRTTDTDSISLVINNDPPGGSTLGGTLSVAAINGRASFTDININQAGIGFTLNATAAGLTLATSNAFNINAVPTQLAITQEPTNTYKDATITPVITVEIQDASGNLVPTATNTVTLSFNTDPTSGSATLGGTLSVAAVGGIATFNDITLDVIDTGYIFEFTATGLTSATSTAFDIEEAPATQLVFTQQPTDAVAGVNINPAITVELRDASNNLVTSETSNVTIALGTDPSLGSATLAGTTTVAAVAGIATFNDINLDYAVNGYTLTVSSGALATDTSTTFNISPAAKSQVAFSVQPSDTDMNANINPAIEVEIQDAFGNKTSDTDTITLAISNDPSASATLSGTLSIAAIDGTATFNDININYAGVGFTLDASAAGLTPATSNGFTINGVPTQLAITTQPSNTDQLAVISPDIVLEVRDANNMLVTNATNNVTLAFGTDPSGSAFIGGTTSKSAVAGIVTFNDITIDTAGTGYTFDFTAAGLTNIVSNAFDINVAIPTVTIDPLPAINLNNHTSYVVTGTCSEDTRTVTLSIGGVPATPTCSGGVYNSGAVDVSGVTDNANVLITADHDNAMATPAVQATQNVVKDTDAPDIVSNNISANTYNLNDTITVNVVFDQVVNVTGLPRLELFFQSQSTPNIYANYNGGSGTNTLVFEYTIQAGDADPDGIAAAASLDLNSGTLRDANANDAVLTLAAADYSSVFVDSAVPSITEFIEPVDGTYPDGVGLLFQVNFNEAVNITGTPRVTVNVGGSIRYANYKTGTGTTGLEFEYIVQPGDSDLDGITLPSNSIDLNGGTVRGLDSDDAVLDFTLYADAMPGVIVDTATGITPPDQVTGLTTAPTTSNTELALSWAVPNDNGTAITSYAVQYREQGQSTWITLNPAPLTNSTTVTGLSAGITYEFRVSANNGLLGPFSAVATAEIFDVMSLNPIAWLDATNVNGNGSSPADGVKVATWVDLTGAAQDATEGNVANQPVMEYNAQNGLPAVRFENHAVGLQGSFTRSIGQNLTFVIVGQFDNGYNDRCLFEFRSGGARGFFIDRRYASNTNFNPVLTKGSFNLWRIEDTGPSAILTENSTTEIFNGNILFNTDFTGTGTYTLGDDDTGGNRMYGYIAEFLVFDRALTAQEINTLEQYLRNKWGTP